MSNIAKIEVTGAKEIEKIIRKLPEKVARRVLRTAVSAAARHIRDEAKKRVPVRTGNLKKSIIAQKAHSRDWREVKFYVGPGKGKNYDGYYGHMVEFGTVKMAPRPFLRPAFEEGYREAIGKMKERAKKKIEQEMRKLAK